MQWPDWNWLRSRDHDHGRLATRKIDMGSGRFLTAADLIEGHFHRLARQWYVQSSATANAQTVTVQVKPDLQVAIAVLAPELAPLAAVASEVAQAMPQVQPTRQFRQELHRALEQTHRQQQAQRLLGTRPPQHEPSLAWFILGGVGLLLVALLLGRARLQRHRTLRAASP